MQGSEIESLLAQLTVHLQPVFDLETGQVRGFEALLRPHPWGGWNVPDLYLRAEAEGFLSLLERRARELALQAAKQHLRAGERLFLNLDERVPLSGWETSAGQVVVEVLEGRPLSEETLAELARLAYPIYLDDFGTGRANLDRLLALRPAGIKIASHLVRGVAEDRAREALLRAIVEVARAIGADVIAEGVETPAELQAIYRVGIRQAQGYLLGRPVPVPDRGAYARLESELVALLPRHRVARAGRSGTSRPVVAVPAMDASGRRRLPIPPARRQALAERRREAGRLSKLVDLASSDAEERFLLWRQLAEDPSTLPGPWRLTVTPLATPWSFSPCAPEVEPGDTVASRTAVPPGVRAIPIRPGGGVRREGDVFAATAKGYVFARIRHGRLEVTVRPLPTMAVGEDGAQRLDLNGEARLRGSIRAAEVRSTRALFVDGGLAHATLSMEGAAVALAGIVAFSRVHVVPPSSARMAEAALRTTARQVATLVALVAQVPELPGFSTADWRHKGVGALLELLARLPRFQALGRSLDNVALPPSSALDRIVRRARDLLTPQGLAALRTVEPLERLAHDLTLAADALLAPHAPPTMVAAAIENSVVEVAGNLVVTGKGIYRSDVRVGGSLIVPEGFLRASSVQAGGVVVADEVGSRTVEQRMTVEAEELWARVVHPRVELVLRGRRLVVDRVRQHVRLSVRGEEVVETYWRGHR